MFASSSSVYGLTAEKVLTESQVTDTPASFYAASKKCNEIMAHSYSNLFQIPTTALRLFTVYGPWGRPDMAYHAFTKSILKREQIALFNSGDMLRDFTYIDDVIESIYKLLDKPPPCNAQPPFNVFNIGNNHPISLKDFITTLEEIIGLKAEKILLPMPKGDVKNTRANTNKLKNYISFKPNTEIKYGLEKFYTWYKSYYKCE
jgi:UDP-glucuronate 4-epimerase